MFNKTIRNWAASALVLALAACGGGGGGGADGGIGGTGGGGDGGIGGTGVAFGGITAFGSVWVNGVRYNTDTAVFKLDDRNVTQADLRVGMVVRVDGSISSSSTTNSSAATVTVDEAIKGRVEQVLDANRMLVMGQTVQIDDLTRFDNGVVPVLGDAVHVHGLVVSDGTVAASYMEKKSALGTPPFAVKGFVKAHDSVAQTFTVGTLSVRYTGAVTGDMPAGSWNGLVVQVKGSNCASTPVCGTLTATQVEPNGPRVSSASAAEFEGYVDSVSASGFSIGAQQVVMTASTVYENGVAADLVVGMKLEVEGSISGGVLTARKVSFRDNGRLEGDVATVSGNSLTLAGLPGVVVQTNSLTSFRGVGSAAGLAAPNHLRIRGRVGPANTLVATELELRDLRSDNTVVLRGPVTVKASPSLTILELGIDTSTVPDTQFKDTKDAVIGRTAFFNALNVGSAVKAKGSLRSGAVRWDEMELED
jgi:cytoskeletal protein CcmA (bactofilin family)